MTTATVTIDLPVPVSVAWDYLSDYRNATEYVDGLTRYEPIGELDHGLGAEFAGTLKIGASINTVFKVVDWDEGKLAVFASKVGLTSTTTYRFSPIDEENSRVDLEMRLGAPSDGLVKRTTARLLEPLIGATFERTAKKIEAGVLRYAQRSQ